MRTTSAYTFRAGAAGEERRFRIEVETASAQGKLLAHLNAVNNGAQGGAHFSFVLSQPATVNARIITPTGKVAAVVARGVEGKQGLNTFTWNGKTASGASLPRGVYLVEVEAVTDEGQVVKDVRTFALR
jgi:flagellar hook assembly protein FlgD